MQLGNHLDRRETFRAEFQLKSTIFSELFMRDESLFFMYLDLIMVTKKKQQKSLGPCSHSSVLIQKQTWKVINAVI